LGARLVASCNSGTYADLDVSPGQVRCRPVQYRRREASRSNVEADHPLCAAALGRPTRHLEKPPRQSLRCEPGACWPSRWKLQLSTPLRAHGRSQYYASHTSLIRWVGSRAISKKALPTAAPRRWNSFGVRLRPGALAEVKGIILRTDPFHDAWLFLTGAADYPDEIGSLKYVQVVIAGL
jgi:hypothetical protein